MNNKKKTQAAVTENRLYHAFPFPGIRPGDEVMVIRGIKTYASPDKVTVAVVYPCHILLRMEFGDAPDRLSHVKTVRYVSVNRASLFCGDAELRRVFDGKCIGRCEGDAGEDNG